MAFTNGGGARRQARHRSNIWAVWTSEAFTGRSSASPQRAHAAASWVETSDQQAAQIGAEESCGRRDPHREHEVGRTVQAIASKGLRSTRDTARHLEISDGVASNVSEPESLRKTHLLRGRWQSPPRTLSIQLASNWSQFRARWSTQIGSRKGNGGGKIPRRHC